MHKYLLVLTLTLGLGLAAQAQQAQGPKLEKIFVSTAENSGIHGDAILLIFDQPMTRVNWVDGRISHSPMKTPKAPAGYANQNNGQSARNAARNYIVKILPGPGSDTPPFEGTWADLGGTAIFEAHDSEGKMVLLLPPNSRSKLFVPGDSVEVTVSSSVTDPQGRGLNTAAAKRQSKAS